MDHLSPDRLEEILDGVRGVRALVLGDLMLDIYLEGSASRISPEAPVPVVHVQREWHGLGGAANVAHNIVSLGAACTVAGCIGRDAAGSRLRQELGRRGVLDGGVREVDGRPTSVKTRLLVRGQQVARYDRELAEDLDASGAAAVVQAVEDLGADSDVIIVEDYDKGVLVPPVIEAALDVGRRRDVPVVVDPKARHFFSYPGAMVFKPNRAELEAALRAPVLADSPEWMERTRRHLDCAHLLVTLGADGMALRTETGDSVRVESVARSVFDVSGAGDTVVAVVGVALAAGASMVEAAVLANCAAGVEVGKAGVATVEPEELRAAARASAAVPAAEGSMQGRSEWRS